MRELRSIVLLFGVFPPNCEGNDIHSAVAVSNIGLTTSEPAAALRGQQPNRSRHVR